MRVLALVVALASACYDPSIEDCQFRCGPAMDCPDGTDCVSGFCRSMATGSCGVADPCPAGTPTSPTGCTIRFALENNGCGVVCASAGSGERSWDAAAAACADANWQFGMLDSAMNLNAVPSSSNPAWVGASRVGLNFQWPNGDIVSPAAWQSGVEPGPTSGNRCAILGGTTRRLTNNTSCGDTERYICTYPLR